MKRNGLTIEIRTGSDWIPGYYAYLMCVLNRKWFQRQSFLVFDHMMEKIPNAVYFPYLPEVLLDSEFRKVTESIVSNEVTYETDFLSIPVSKKLISKFPPFTYEEIPWLSEFMEIKDEIFDYLERSLTDAPFGSFTIIIHPVRFGTRGSFVYLKGENTIKMTLRHDADMSHLIKILVYAYIDMKYVHPEGNIAWNEREAIVDYIMTRTPLRKYLEKRPYVSLFRHLKNTSVNSALYEKSDRYLKKLGLSFSHDAHIDDSGVIVINGTRIHGLAKNAFVVLSYLVRNKGVVCSVDELSEALYSERAADKFSIQYIAKLIEEIRKVLELNGLSKNVIQTQRKAGYLIR